MPFLDRGNAKKVIYIATYDAHENLVEICRSIKHWSHYIYILSSTTPGHNFEKNEWFLWLFGCCKTKLKKNFFFEKIFVFFYKIYIIYRKFLDGKKIL